MKKALILLLILSNTCFADVKFLNKGEPAPFEGFLFDRKAEMNLRLTEEKLEFCDKSKEILNSLNKNQEDRYNIMTDRLKIRDQQIDTLAKRVVESRESFWVTNIGFFILGALVTTGVAYGVSRTIR